MDSRRRGATGLLAALVLGRLLDLLDLPFERRSDPGGSDAAPAAAPDSSHTPGTGPAPAPAAAALPAPGAASVPQDSTVPVNRATAAELQRLPGLGPVLASRVVAERDARGPFQSAADLRRVKGIGPKTCARLAPHLRFD